MIVNKLNLFVNQSKRFIIITCHAYQSFWFLSKMYGGFSNEVRALADPVNKRWNAPIHDEEKAGSESGAEGPPILQRSVGGVVPAYNHTLLIRGNEIILAITLLHKYHNHR